jgi:hypothetical protein
MFEATTNDVFRLIIVTGPSNTANRRYVKTMVTGVFGRCCWVGARPPTLDICLIIATVNKNDKCKIVRLDTKESNVTSCASQR